MSCHITKSPKFQCDTPTEINEELNTLVRKNNLKMEVHYLTGKYDTPHCHYHIEIEDSGETIVDMEIRYPINEGEVLLELIRELRVRKLNDLI